MITLVILAGAAALIWYISGNKKGPAGPAAAGPAGKKPAPVTYIIARDTLVEQTIRITGTLLSSDEIIVSPEISGRISKIYFREGAPVQQGALLVKLDDSELQARLQRLLAQKKLAEATQSRQKALLDKGGSSREEQEIAENTVITLNADIALAKAQLAKTELRAPFSGTAGLRYISEGGYVSAGTRITDIVKSNPIRVECNIPEKYGTQFRPGMLLRFNTAGQDQQFNAHIIAIDPKIDQNTRTLRLRAECANPQGILRPGSFAEIQLALSTPSQAVMIPTESVVPDIKGQRIFIIKNGRAMARPVQTGLRTDRAVEILRGVAMGDSVIVSGLMGIRPDMPVQAAPAIGL